MQQKCKILAEKNASNQEQKKYAIEIGNIFIRMGNKIIKSQYGEEYYLPIAQFFYKKAIPYYTLAADFYHKDLNLADKQAKARYLEIINLLADLHHRIQNFSMRDYYNKLAPTIMPGSKKSDQGYLQWQQKAASVKESANNKHFHFWSQPLELIKHKINTHASRSNFSLTH